VWQVFPGINEAHNGYLQMYVQLGFIGLLLLAGFSVILSINLEKTDAFRICAPQFGVMDCLSFYNVTEAAFQGGMLWLTLLPGVLVLHQREIECYPELFSHTTTDKNIQQNLE
jgi:O-antigen ligase